MTRYGFVYFKGDKSSSVWFLNQTTGLKRHVTSAEAVVLRAIKSEDYAARVVIPQASADAILEYKYEEGTL